MNTTIRYANRVSLLPGALALLALLGPAGSAFSQCEPPCVNGVCVDSSCQCYVGWQGIDCSIAVCEPTCVNGFCSAPDVCTCNAGWTGDICDEPVCDPACVNGVCTGPDTCSCSAGWTGDICDDPICSNPCVHGTCTAPEVCTCDAGWTGATCEQSVCGDGIIVGPEECDDNGTDNGDGCSSACLVEEGWRCSGEPSVCYPEGVPAITGWGVVVLSLLVLAVGTLVFMRRQAQGIAQT